MAIWLHANDAYECDDYVAMMVSLNLYMPLVDDAQQLRAGTALRKLASVAKIGPQGSFHAHAANTYPANSKAQD